MDGHSGVELVEPTEGIDGETGTEMYGASWTLTIGVISSTKVLESMKIIKEFWKFIKFKLLT